MLICCFVFWCMLSGYSQDFQKAACLEKSDSSVKSKTYRGSIDIGGAYWGDGIMLLSTCHGYQFNPYFFLGAGVGFGSDTLPLFVDARADILDNDVSPFLDARIGCSFIDGVGAYVNTSVGVSFRILGRLWANASVGYYFNQWNFEGVSMRVGLEF